MIKVKSIEGKYYCLECGQWTDDVEVNEWDENRGEFWGMPCTEHMVEWLCPNCGSDGIIEADEVCVEEEEE